MSDLPTGWETVELGEHVYVAGRIGWRGLKRAEYANAGPVFLAVKNILPNGEIDFQDVGHISIERYNESPEIQLAVGDILLTKDGTIGKVGIVSNLPAKTTVNSSILVVRPNQLINQRFLFYYLRSPAFQSIAAERITGSSIPHLFQKDIKKLVVAVPPINEQNRIVEKLEKLLERVEAAQMRLDRIPAILKRFRQSVLAAACSGALTADWRSDETNDETLGFPADWQLLSADAVCSRITDGEHQTPKRLATGRMLLSARNVRDGFIDYREHGLISQEDFDKCLRRCKAVPGDVLLVCVGATIGRAAIVDSPQEFALVRSVALLKPNMVLGQFLLRAIQSQFVQDQIRDVSKGSAQPSLFLNRISALVIPVPSLDEQKEIVRRVERLFKFADQSEDRYKKVLSYTDKLTQSILAKAVRGDLVLQNPNDESASINLERIQTAKVELTTQAKNIIRTKRKPMKRNDVDVEVAIRQMATKTFSFDDLKREVSTDYESLKAILFSLLGKANPIVKQVFDPESQSIKFIGIEQ